VRARARGPPTDTTRESMIHTGAATATTTRVGDRAPRTEGERHPSTAEEKARKRKRHQRPRGETRMEGATCTWRARGAGAGQTGLGPARFGARAWRIRRRGGASGAPAQGVALRQPGEEGRGARAVLERGKKGTEKEEEGKGREGKVGREERPRAELRSSPNS
jgi:hypothetical protein